MAGGRASEGLASSTEPIDGAANLNVRRDGGRVSYSGSRSHIPHPRGKREAPPRVYSDRDPPRPPARDNGEHGYYAFGVAALSLNSAFSLDQV
jgi:hypothetical protein